MSLTDKLNQVNPCGTLVQTSMLGIHVKGCLLHWCFALILLFDCQYFSVGHIWVSSSDINVGGSMPINLPLGFKVLSIST